MEMLQSKSCSVCCRLRSLRRMVASAENHSSHKSTIYKSVPKFQSLISQKGISFFVLIENTSVIGYCLFFKTAAHCCVILYLDKVPFKCHQPNLGRKCQMGCSSNSVTFSGM